MTTVNEVMCEVYGEDWRDRCPVDHVFEMKNDYATDYKDLMIISSASAHDVFGYEETVYVANYRTLTNEWEHLDGFNNVGPYSNVDHVSLDALEEGSRRSRQRARSIERLSVA